MTVIVPPPPGATTRPLVISAPCRPSCCLGGGTPKCAQGRLEPLNSLLQRVCVWRRRRRCSPFVGIHITDQRFWPALGYCPLLPGHLHGRVNTAAQRLTTSHPKLTQLSPPHRLHTWPGSVTRRTLCLADVARWLRVGDRRARRDLRAGPPRSESGLLIY